ncbi:hypothetical protein FKW77_001528 [Venturia effusa]|uniref:Uncharacterized protein n=1 Tax=Venturia effusa TaxID=50376 RepID=A0A517LNI8_9PEZI|nr:hypothetical protein FKW77_001528 [Venturia effusa]
MTRELSDATSLLLTEGGDASFSAVLPQPSDPTLLGPIMSHTGDDNPKDSRATPQAGDQPVEVELADQENEGVHFEANMRDARETPTDSMARASEDQYTSSEPLSSPPSSPRFHDEPERNPELPGPLNPQDQNNENDVDVSYTEGTEALKDQETGDVVDMEPKEGQPEQVEGSIIEVVSSNEARAEREPSMEGQNSTTGATTLPADSGGDESQQSSNRMDTSPKDEPSECITLSEEPLHEAELQIENQSNVMDFSTAGPPDTQELGTRMSSDAMDTDLQKGYSEQAILSQETIAYEEASIESRSTIVASFTTGTAEIEPAAKNTGITKTSTLVDDTIFSWPDPRKDSIMRLASDTYEHGRGSVPPTEKLASRSIVLDHDNASHMKRSASEDPLFLRSAAVRIRSAKWMETTSFPNDVKRRKLSVHNVEHDDEIPNPRITGHEQILTLDRAIQRCDVSSNQESPEIIDLEELEQKKLDKIDREAQEKEAAEQEQAARLAQEAEEEHRQELQGYSNNFLASFQNAGVSTDEAVNPQEARYAAVTSEGLAAILQLVQQVRGEAKEDVQMLLKDNEVLRDELQKSKETEAKLAGEIKELTDSRAQKIWKKKAKAEREKMEAELARVEEKLDLLRAPDVTLEDMKTTIDGFNQHLKQKLDGFVKEFSNMRKEVEKTKSACEAEKKLLNTARLNLTKEFRNRKSGTDRLKGELQIMDTSLEELSSRVRDLEASAEQVQHTSRSDITGSELSEDANNVTQLRKGLEDIAQLRKDLEKQDERMGIMQDDIDVFRDHVTTHFFDKDCPYPQRVLNRTYYADISDLKFRLSELRRQLVTSVSKLRAVDRPADSHLIALDYNLDSFQSEERHVNSLDPQLPASSADAEGGASQQDSKVEVLSKSEPSTIVPPPINATDLPIQTNIEGVINTIQAHADAIVKINEHIKRFESKQVDLEAGIDGLSEQVQAQSTLLTEFQDQVQQPANENTEIEDRINTLIDPVKATVDGLIEDLRLLTNEVATVRTESREADQALDDQIGHEKVERIQGDLKELVTRTTTTAVYGRYINGLMGYMQKTLHKSPIELEHLVKEEDKHCGKASYTMTYWNTRIVKSLHDKTGDDARELMVVINKMLKGEAISKELRKYYIDKDEDEVLLKALQKNLRKVLATQGIWSRQNIDLTAGSDSETE